MTDPVVPPAAPAYQPAVVTGPKTNVLAIVGFILAFVVTLAGIIVSAIALRQIKQTGEGGHGLALAGVILGIVFSIFWIIYFVVVIGALIFEGTVANSVY
jgi:Domain of unknown function (DUF4190)